MLNPQSAIALCTALLALAGCDEKDWSKTIGLLRGDVHELQMERSDLLDDQIAALKDQPNPDEGELDSLRAQLSELANRLDSLGTSIPPEAANTVPEPSMSSSEVSEECVTIYAKQTCEDGVLHHLGPNFEWID